MLSGPGVHHLYCLQKKGTEAVDTRLMEVIAKLDNETFAHCKRVKKIAKTLGKSMGLTLAELGELKQGALLHDIGKLQIPRKILQKKTPLTKDEWELIKKHPVLGWEYVSEMDLPLRVKNIILGHHVWANGKGGYPSMVSKPCILTQITTVADVVDAMTSDRSYRAALSMVACVEYLEKNQGVKFNSDVVREFIKLISYDDFGTMILK